ncbi:branched-chain amino acid ABC transporter permease [Ancylobacter sonchi]|uniref:branched-chain amino acid ABC transporter permease n=1 Tax=Ancylobacter sonchi TaxID=1937790 RepID=UPI001BD40059|nr:branched-chain amino acid ABC transporter permease [Ancylobacter sonchi]MBS7537081.1 branched-chain amino acid ABC transporter permease [Ancylobacter sonchi]
MSEFALHVATIAALYAMLALSLNLQAGFAGLINFGQIALFGCGTYGAALAFSHALGPLAGFALGLVLVVLVALLFARLGRNLGADYWGIATLSIGEILRTIATNEIDITGGAQGIGGIPALFDTGSPLSGRLILFAVVLAALIATWFAFRRLTQSKFGLSLRLLREEPQLAAAFGYDLDGLRRRIMLAAALPAALSGFLFAHYLTFVGPDQLFASETFVIWTMVVVGGLGSHAGAVIGAIVVQCLFALVPFAKDAFGLPSEFVAAMRLVLIGGGLIGFLLLRPQGLIPERIGGVRG